MPIQRRDQLGKSAQFPLTAQAIDLSALSFGTATVETAYGDRAGSCAECSQSCLYENSCFPALKPESLCAGNINITLGKNRRLA